MLLALALWSKAGSAQVLVPGDPGEHAGGLITIRSTSIEASVEAQVASVKMTQAFENHLGEPRAGSYVFALPERAAVSSFATWVEGRKVLSRVEGKKAARESFQRAARQGASPALLENIAKGVFRTEIEGIPALGTKRTEIEYSELLPYESGELSLRIPLHVGAYQAQGLGNFSARILVHDKQKRILEVSVGDVPAIIHRIDEHRVEVQIQAKDLVADHDLQLSYQVSGDELGFSFVANKSDDEGDGSFLLSIAPQELTEESDLVKKDVLFVFDSSGSMSGMKIEQARSALKRCIALLQNDDRFSILAFSDGLTPWRRWPVPANSENRRSALSFVEGISAGGGTAINAALGSGLGAFEKNGRPKVLVFFTDGEPTVGVTRVGEILQNARNANKLSARIFAFGVEGGSNQRFLEQLAVQNRGSAASVTPGQSIDEVVASFYRGISRPVLSDISFDFEPVTVSLQYPLIMPDIYKGQQLVISGRFRGEGAGRVTLRGQLNGKQRSFELPVVFPEGGNLRPFVARQWARMRIAALLAQSAERGVSGELRDEVVRLGVRHSLVTPYTSMVATPELAFASLSPSRIKPGDPEILIPAQEDARAVVVVLPFGPHVDAHYDPNRGVWAARFLVPPMAEDGVFEVAAFETNSSGQIRRHSVSYTVDTKAAVLRADPVAPIRAGERFVLHVRPVLNLLQVGAALAQNKKKDALELTKSFSDLRQVSVFLWDGRELELGLQPLESGWSASIETSRELAPGSWPLRIVAVDWAGNMSQLELSLQVEPHYLSRS